MCTRKVDATTVCVSTGVIQHILPLVSRTYCGGSQMRENMHCVAHGKKEKCATMKKPCEQEKTFTEWEPCKA